MQYRIESDSIGQKQVPVEAYYGVQSLRGCENFQITGQRLRKEFIESLAQIKKACAICNHQVGQLDAAITDAICKACKDFDPEMVLLGLSGSEFGPAAQRAGIPFAAEFFADRAYNDDGSLVNRKLPGAVIHDADEAVARVLQMAKEGTVTTITGNTLTLGCASVCVHGDNEAAVELVKSINAALAANGVETADLKTVLAHAD